MLAPNSTRAINVRSARFSTAAPKLLVAPSGSIGIAGRRSVLTRFQEDTKTGKPIISEEDKRKVGVHTAASERPAPTSCPLHCVVVWAVSSRPAYVVGVTQGSAATHTLLRHPIFAPCLHCPPACPMLPAPPHQVLKTPEGEISAANAERRANLGDSVDVISQVQAFDGPAPETINGRGAMAGVVLGLILEKVTGLGLREQCGDHPLFILGVFVLIALASYIPIAR